MSTSTFRGIFNICLSLMNTPLSAFGLTFNMWQLLLFSLILYIVINTIYRLFMVE